MKTFRELISNLPERHQVALIWFLDHSGQDHKWPGPIQTRYGLTYLATRAKGIYKPQWSEFALSV